MTEQSPQARQPPMLTDQRSALLALVREELIPRAIHLNEDASEWRCDLCRYQTPVEQAADRMQARHSTFCRLGRFVEVCE